MMRRKATSSRGRGAKTSGPRALAGGAGSDGGYFAIKGFLYQFDKTILEVIDNPLADVTFECVEDIACEDWVMQVKHKERTDFAPSRLSRPLRNLLVGFCAGVAKRQVLYCHFRDKSPGDWRPTRRELEAILGDQAEAACSAKKRAEFAKALTIRFSEDFEAQFLRTVKAIRTTLGLSDEAEAVVAHSLLRSELLRRAAGPMGARKVSLRDLKRVVSAAEGTITKRGYAKYLTEDKYRRLIRQQFFTFKTVNIEGFERLVVAEAEAEANVTDIVRFVGCVGRKFFRKGKSPQPYVVIRGLTDELLRESKRAALDSRVTFFDGTFFDGDRFRAEELLRGSTEMGHCAVKWLGEAQLKEIQGNVRFRETYEFFVDSTASDLPSGKHVCVQADRLTEMVAMME